MDRLIGTGVALVTPFDEQQRIDRESLYRLVNYVIDGGVDFLVALGTTAETATSGSTPRRSAFLTKWTGRSMKPIRGVFP